MLVKEVMTSKVEQVRPATPLKQSAAIMRDLGVGSLAVAQDGRLLGVVTDRDITCRGVAGACDPEKTEISKIMTRNVVCCYDDQHVIDVIDLMEEKSVRRLPVLDRDERLVGIVSLTDLFHGLSDDLPSHVMTTVSLRH